MRSDTRMLLYWDKEGKEPQLSVDERKSLEFILIHQRYLSAFQDMLFNQKKPYFRLRHDNRRVEEPKVPKGYEVVQVNPRKEADLVCDFLAQCHPTYSFSEERVLKWMEVPVFDPSLWIWVIDEETNMPAALGISDLDPTIPEASLEWIQVLLQHRGKGLGKLVVLETLKRVIGRVSFTTVSGEVNNPSNPESLYRRCGFQGNDVWWVLQK